MKLEKNYRGYGERFLRFFTIEQFKVGDILTDMKHWSNGSGGLWLDDCELRPYNYCFECEEITGHEVDYNRMREFIDDEEEEINENYNKEYYDYLSDNFGTSCEYDDETEIIVDASERFEIIEIWKRDEEHDEITEADFEAEDVNYLVIKVRRI